MDKKAFTLTEIIVVIIIISVIASLALPRMWSSVQRSKSTEAANSFSTLVRDFERCMMADGVYYDCGTICQPADIVKCQGPALADSAFNRPGSNFSICNGPSTASGTGFGWGIEVCLNGGDALDRIQFFYGSPDIAGASVGWGGRTIGSSDHGITAIGYGVFEGFTMAPN